MVTVYRLGVIGTWRLVVLNKGGSCSRECVSAWYLHRMALASVRKSPNYSRDIGIRFRKKLYWFFF